MRKVEEPVKQGLELPVKSNNCPTDIKFKQVSNQPSVEKYETPFSKGLEPESVIEIDDKD